MHSPHGKTYLEGFVLKLHCSKYNSNKFNDNDELSIRIRQNFAVSINYGLQSLQLENFP